MEPIEIYLTKHCTSANEVVVAAAVARLATGVTFHAHMSAEVKVADLIFQFLPAAQEPHLYFYLAGKSPSPDQQCALHEIRGISHGRHTDVLQQVDKKTHDHLLFTLHTTTNAMNLEATSKEDIDTLVLAIWSHQQQVGSKVLTFLSAGQVFAIHGQADGEDPKPVTVPKSMVVYMNNPESPGQGDLAVFNTDAPTTESTPFVRFPVHTISVISPAGIHDWLKQHLAAKTLQFDPLNTLTLTTSSGMDIHLEAPNRDVHESWLAALQAYMQQHAAHEEAKNANKEGLVPLPVDEKTLELPVGDASAPPVAERPEEKAKRDDYHAAIEAAKVAAAAAAAAEAAAAAAAAERKRQEEEEKKKKDDDAAKAKTEAPVAAVAAVVAVAAADGEVKRTGEAKKPPMLERQPSAGPSAYSSYVTVSGDAGAAPAPRALGAKDPRAIMQEGAKFHAFFDIAPAGSPTPQIVARELFVFFVPADDASMGALHWCDPTGPRTINALNRLPFGRISDVFLGKQHPILQSPSAAIYDKSHCFSLMAGATWGLHLVADLSTIRTDWLAGIRYVFTGSGKVVSENAAGLKHAATAPTVADSKTAAAAQQYLKYIREGTDFKVFFPQEAVADEKKIIPLHSGITAERTTDRQAPFFIYWYPAAESFYYSDGRDISATEQTRIPFSKITGMDLEVGWEGLGLDAYQRNIVIRTTESDYYLKTASPADRTSLYECYQQLKLKIDPDHKRILTAQALLVPHDVSVFYVDPPFGARGADREGTLYYCHPGKRDRHPDHCIQLSEVTDVYTGTTNRQDSRLVKLIQDQRPPIQCLFTVRSPGAQLILLAPNELDRTSWLKGLQAAIEFNHGKVRLDRGSSHA